MALWNLGGMDLARMHANKHHVRQKLQQEQRERDMHHNIAEAGDLRQRRGPLRLFYYPVRLFRWLWR